MSSKKITELIDASLPLTGGEYVPIVQSGSTVKTTTDDIADLAIGDVALTDIAAVYELNVPFKQFVGSQTIAFYVPSTGAQINPSQFVSNSKAVVYKSTVDPGLFIQSLPLTQNTSLSWTVGGSLDLGLDGNNTGFYFSLTNTPKIATKLVMGSGYISSINFNTERIGSLQISPAEYQNSTLDLSSLKSCTGSFSIGGAFTGKTLDVSSLENWGYFLGVSTIGLSDFNNIILPTNLKTAAKSADFSACSFDQPTVDAILQMFVDLDGTNGTELWQGDALSSGATLNLAGSNAAPSVGGLANVAILNARVNTTVLTN